MSKLERFNKLDFHFTNLYGPFAVVRKCNHCDHTEIVKTGKKWVGRGYGFREGNKARGRMIQHIKANHQDKI